MNGRILELDAIRGFAALAIVLAHGKIVSGSPWVLSAVDLFFVLSSYLITTMVLRYRREKHFLRTFYYRRFLRIWPPYYLALGAALVLNQFLLYDYRADAWAWYATFTQNLPLYWGVPWTQLPDMPRTFWHTWTLAIEEQFYVLWPFLLITARRWRVLATATVFILLPPLLRAPPPSFEGMKPIMQYVLATRSDGLGMGAILAVLLFDDERVKRHVVAYRIAFLAIAAWAIWWTTGSSVVRGIAQPLFYTRVNMIYFALVGLLVTARGRPWLAPLRWPALTYVGTISYALYLYHPIVFAALDRPWRRVFGGAADGSPDPVREWALVVACFLVAEASRRWFEGPILAFKDKLSYRAPRKAPALATATGTGSTEGVGDATGEARPD